MSGGSLNYLCYKEPHQLFDYVGEMEAAEEFLIKKGDLDIAKDVRRLIEYIRSAENRVSVLSEQLNDVFHAVEWRLSADYGDKSLQEALDRYRGKEGARS